MKNHPKNQSGIENAVMELREIISDINKVLSCASEILSQVTEITAEAEEIKPAILFLIPELTIEMLEQERRRKEETNWEITEPKQATTVHY